jgi:SAM-dependent methyltransferase/uncharacterized protein YbaR (Trm112 family)
LRRGHFEALRPLCPVCQQNSAGAAPLDLAHVYREEGDIVVEGILHCTGTACQREYPILDGVPLLIADGRSYVANQLLQLVQREDLSAEMATLLGDCCGPGSAFDVDRQHLSTYARDHYGDLDPAEHDEPRPGSMLTVLNRLLPLLPGSARGPVLDLGCSVGRSSFALAERAEALVLGVDLNIAMLRLAQRVLRQGMVRYPRRRVGLVYDQREFAAPLPQPERVDFWACDVLALPFAADSFALAVGLNILDCVRAPCGLLTEVVRVVQPGGALALTTPYDWSPAATPVEAWLGGHSQRGPGGGSSEPWLRRLLTPGAHPQSVAGIRITADIDRLPWTVRLHDRSHVHYDVHAVMAEVL